MRPAILRYLAVVFLLLGLPRAAGAQSATVWSGVYTTEQATRGKVTYDEFCSGCHGPYLEGFRSTGSAKALARDPFMDRWEGATLDELYQFMRAEMPKNAATKVSDAAKLDIVAYIMQVNEFPAGTAPLAPQGLAAVRIQSKDGARPLKSGMTVQAVGCVSQVGKQWLLTRATEPARTRTDVLSSGSDLAANAAKSGTATVALVDAIPEPKEYTNQKVEVKGLFLPGQPPGINILGLQKVADSCQ